MKLSIFGKQQPPKPNTDEMRIDEVNAVPYYERISPDVLSAAVSALSQRMPQLRPIRELYERLLDADGSTFNPQRIRRESLKSGRVIIKSEHSEKQLTWMKSVIDKIWPSVCDMTIDWKLQGHVFRQLIWNIYDGYWYPQEFLSYISVDLRVENRKLALYAAKERIEPQMPQFVALCGKRAELRTVFKYYMIANFALNNWARFSEMFGMPLKVGKYPTGSTQDAKNLLWSALQQSGNAQAMMISEDMVVEFVESAVRNASSDLYATLHRTCEEMTTKVILGQVLTTTAQPTGSYAQAKVHEMVRQDILAGDRRDCKTMLTMLLNTMSQINFGEQEVLADIVFDGPFDPEKELNIDSRLQSEFGWTFTDEYLAEKYNRPMPVKSRPFEAASRSNYLAIAYPSGMSKSLREAIVAVGERYTAYKTHLQTSITSLDELREETPPFAAAMAMGEKLSELLLLAYTSGKKSRANGRVVAEFSYNLIDIKAVWAMRASSFEVAGVQSEELMNMLREEAAKAIEQGSTFMEWRDNIMLYGFEPDNPYHLRTNFDTGIAAATSASQWEDIQATKHLFPYLRYVAVMDGRTREEHAALNGIVRHVDDAFWDVHMPPNGWNCRCDIAQLTQQEAEQAPGLQRVEPSENVSRIDPNFRYNPGKNPDIWAMWLQEKVIPLADFNMFGGASSSTFAQNNAILPQERTVLQVSQLFNDRIVNDSQNYPVRLAGESAGMGPAAWAGEVEATLRQPAEIWMNERLVNYFRSYQDGIMVVSVQEGVLHGWNIMDSSSADALRTGLRMK